MNEDEKNLIRDMLRTPGWELIKKMNDKAIGYYRIMATQEPSAIAEDHRTWISGKAAGREELFQQVVDSIKV